MCPFNKDNNKKVLLTPYSSDVLCATPKTDEGEAYSDVKEINSVHACRRVGMFTERKKKKKHGL